MSDFNSIKELVLETCVAEGVFPSYEKLTSLVLQHFPNSKWQKTHYAWYKSQIKTGKIPLPEGALDDNGDVTGSDEIESEVEESIVASLSLERDLHRYLAARVEEIESGLALVDGGVEYQTDAGRIDLLARDRDDNLVVIELKASVAKDAALGQLLGYVGCLSSAEREPSEKSIRGILVASGFDPRVVFASKGLPHIKLVQYQLSFELKEIA